MAPKNSKIKPAKDRTVRGYGNTTDTGRTSNLFDEAHTQSGTNSGRPTSKTTRPKPAWSQDGDSYHKQKRNPSIAKLFCLAGERSDVNNGIDPNEDMEYGFSNKTHTQTMQDHGLGYLSFISLHKAKTNLTIKGISWTLPSHFGPAERFYVVWVQLKVFQKEKQVGKDVTVKQRSAKQNCIKFKDVRTEIKTHCPTTFLSLCVWTTKTSKKFSRKLDKPLDYYVDIPLTSFDKEQHIERFYLHPYKSGGELKQNPKRPERVVTVKPYDIPSEVHSTSFLERGKLPSAPKTTTSSKQNDILSVIPKMTQETHTDWNRQANKKGSSFQPHQMEQKTLIEPSINAAKKFKRQETASSAGTSEVKDSDSWKTGRQTSNTSTQNTESVYHKKKTGISRDNIEPHTTKSSNGQMTDEEILPIKLQKISSSRGLESEEVESENSHLKTNTENESSVHDKNSANTTGNREKEPGTKPNKTQSGKMEGKADGNRRKHIDEHNDRIHVHNQQTGLKTLSQNEEEGYGNNRRSGWKHHRTGIPNLGNTCFANSVLQSKAAESPNTIAQARRFSTQNAEEFGCHHTSNVNKDDKEKKPSMSKTNKTQSGKMEGKADGNRRKHIDEHNDKIHVHNQQTGLKTLSQNEEERYGNNRGSGWKHHRTGIPNLGNTCFANSVLQVLGKTPRLSECLGENNTRSVSLLKAIVDDLNTDQRQVDRWNVDALLRYVFKRDNSFVLGQQNDSHSFLLSLLNCVNNDSGEAAYRLFSGKMMMRFKYSTCNHVEYSEEQLFTSLLMPIYNTDTLDGCMNEHCKEETFPDNVLCCRKCHETKADTVTYKRIIFTELPGILVLQMGRFEEEDRGYHKKIIRKNTTRISFGKYIDLKLEQTEESEKTTNSTSKKISYELYGVVDHSGSIAGGHYTATVKMEQTDDWYYCSDTHVSQGTSPTNKMDGRAYMLFYHLKPCMVENCESDDLES